MNRVAKAAACLGVATGAIALGGGTATATPTGGAVQVWGTPNNHGGGHVIITGAVAASGVSVPANSSGKPEKKGTYKLLEFKKGSILVNTSQLNKAVQAANPTATSFNTATCSGYVPATAAVPIVSGTKAYAGITGSVTITITFAVVIPLQNGKCNTSQNGPNPSAQYTSLTGSGTVSF
jgi:hypothetical protein